MFKINGTIVYGQNHRLRIPNEDKIIEIWNIWTELANKYASVVTKIFVQDIFVGHALQAIS